MRRLRLISIFSVAIGSVALALGVGAGSAFAAAGDTTLCSTATNPCPSANQYPTGTQFSATLASATLQINTNLEEVTCSDASFGFINAAQTGESIPIDIDDWMISGCVDSVGNACTVTFSNLPYEGSIAGDGFGDGDGTVVLNDLSVTLTCGALLDCTFTGPATGIQGSFTGGNPAILTFGDVPLESSGGLLCPPSGTLNVVYKLTGLSSAVWIETSS